MTTSPVDLPRPTVGPPRLPDPWSITVERDGQRFTVHVLDAGLACCTVEVAAALRSGLLGAPLGEEPRVASAVVDVLVVSGTVTLALVPVLQRVRAQLPAGTRVVSYGACAASGGPYWDSYCVTPGVEQLFPVDLVVPGCPPPPSALIDALVTVAR